MTSRTLTLGGTAYPVLLPKVRDPRLTVGRVQVNGARATAEISTSAAGEEPSRDTLRLENVNGTWKISSLGT